MNYNKTTQIKCLMIDSEDKGGWSDFTLETEIPNLFPKIVAVNARYAFFIGGKIEADLMKPPKKEPKNSVFLVDMILQRVLLSKKLKDYRVHSACVLDKNNIYVLGGQKIGGEWSQTCSMLSFNDEDLIEKKLPDLIFPRRDEKDSIIDVPCTLFGPSGYVLNSNVYVAGIHIEDSTTRVLKLEKNGWIEFKNFGDHSSGGFSHLLYIKDSFLIFGGLTLDYKPSSDVYSFKETK